LVTNAHQKKKLGTARARALTGVVGPAALKEPVLKTACLEKLTHKHYSAINTLLLNTTSMHRNVAAAGGGRSYTHAKVANVAKLAKLLTTNAGDPAQIVREALSNCADAGARDAWLVPFPHPMADAGFAIVDNGQGMTRPVQDSRPPIDSQVSEGRVERHVHAAARPSPTTPHRGARAPTQGRYPQICSFMDIGNSFKDASTSIGHMGLGCKLLWDAHGQLFVATKTARDDDFAVLQVHNPAASAGQGEVSKKHWSPS
jgi:hypothetical protein